MDPIMAIEPMEDHLAGRRSITNNHRAGRFRFRQHCKTVNNTRRAAVELHSLQQET